MNQRSSGSEGARCASWRTIPWVRAAVLIALPLGACGPEALTTEQVCSTGIYRLAGGRLIDIGPSEGRDLRWRLDDGRTGRLRADRSGVSTVGWTDRTDGTAVVPPGCSAKERRIEYRDAAGGVASGLLVPLVSTDTKFRSRDTSLSGRLVLPPGSDPVPIVIPVHGSERDSAVRFNFYQRLLPAQGIGVFVYDKRGTGNSAGKYTQDFDVLADDAVAAATEARRMAGTRALRIGFQGTSQGGWIAPLAATRTKVDFVIVDFGLAGSVAEEHRDQVVLELSRDGYSTGDLAAAAQVADATSAIAATHFRSGFDRLEELRSRYRAEPWFKKIHGQFAGEMLKYPSWVVRMIGPLYDMKTPINYDAMAVLRRVDVPMLWVLAGDDTFAPSAATQARLKELAAAGLKVDAIEFPGTEHGIVEIEHATDGSRPEIRYAEGFFRTTLDFARRGQLAGHYGTAVPIVNAAAVATDRNPAGGP
jgi:pimeloyl-ACP methyl ester carboxylesterase